MSWRPLSSARSSQAAGSEYVPFAGQSVGLVDEVLPAAEIVHRTCAQAAAILGELATQRGRTRVGPASS